MSATKQKKRSWIEKHEVINKYKIERYELSGTIYEQLFKMLSPFSKI